ncbi:unnamed protein product [Lampetra fluviatilis]
MDLAAIDSLTMDKLLGLAQEKRIVLLVIEQKIQTSLWVSRCLQAHKNMIRWTPLEAWSCEPGLGDKPTRQAAGSNPRLAEEDPELERKMAGALQGWHRQRGDTQ